MKEFTGERVVPGQVDIDLWNEHLARYAFAARLSSWKRVLDIACGTGYGTAYLAPETRSIIGLDISPDAIHYASEHYQQPNLRYLTASGTALPFSDHSFDLVVAYEVIEHLTDWRALLSEARRVLAPGGQLILSTPNKSYYAESRKLTGPNPYHHHEFTFDEFQDALRQTFPHVSLFVQNHVDGIVFHPPVPDSPANVLVESATVDPNNSHFFLAVCAGVRQMGAPTFVYLPSAGNVLREREQHISRLENELLLKDDWLTQLKAEQLVMVQLFREQKEALEASNRWTDSVKAELKTANDARDTLHRLLDEKDSELTTSHQEAMQMAAGYEEAIAKLEQDNAAKARWATETEERLQARTSEHEQCVHLLRQAEQSVEERTAWAQNLDLEVRTLQDELTRIHDSRWIRLGRTLRLGPGARKK
ncbi:MAG: methyltransferase domain-containing protein [Acidobacteria bacterium]|nr:methyltransferase domain-containing protein [Acidobacteriota bacterium]